ncbi:hypothetical protein RHSIM_RhsimUnG0181900 [Rhododendron simsii]|uniref:Uncharacterized protein n=1 Tax=Rhododendron simsii TaxID=118357 RepID=A0A834FUM6_RHOSS|nr:hypothetical protein RHSIM_RhsimUnG0181900 [Rhododendron simsii]
MSFGFYLSTEDLMFVGENVDSRSYSVSTGQAEFLHDFLQFRKDEVLQEDDIPYRYGFFHLIFFFGSHVLRHVIHQLELGKLNQKVSSRESPRLSQKACKSNIIFAFEYNRLSIDVGWASTWVKIVNEWFAATIYLWKLISPVVRQTKVVNHEEPVQEADTTI